MGRHVARLLAGNYKVVGIGHGEWSPNEWKKWGLSEWHNADVTLGALKRNAGVPSLIVHCAGSGSVAASLTDPLADFERTVGTTAQILEFVRTVAPACRVVYPSSASVYGAVEQFPIREECPLVPISQYGVHKLMAEQMVASYARQFGVSAAIARLFSVYGPGLRKQLLWDACRKFAERDSVFMGTGDEERDWLHVEDAAELLVAAAGQACAVCPTVNGGSGEGTTVRDVLAHLGECLGAEPSTPTFSGTQRKGDPSRYVADIGRSTAWGWSPKRHWREGVKQYATWWKGNSQ